MARTKKVQTAYHVEYTAPVIFKALAIQQADDTNLPQTIAHITEPDGVAYFQVAHCYWFDDVARRNHPADWVVQDIITFLPGNYFAALTEGQ